jgi:Barstar (barnase inhibitor)
MAWRVGIVLDGTSDLSGLLGRMPVWVWSPPQPRSAAEELWKTSGNIWDPDPTLTLINTPIGDDPVQALLAEIPTLESHHWGMTALHVFGLSDSPALRRGLRTLGYEFVSASDHDGAVFTRSMDKLQNVPDLILNAAGWKDRNDVFNSLFRAVGAPEWHGRNFNALNDSIGTGGINVIEVPYRLHVRKASTATQEARLFLKDLQDLIANLRASGCPVDIHVEE